MLNRRLRLTKKEAHHLLGILDSWQEGYPEVEAVASDSDIPVLMKEMDLTMSIRRKLWKAI